MTLIFIFAFILPGITLGQTTFGKLGLSLFTGYASYKMDMLKEVNQYMEESLPFEVKTVNNFDPGFYFGATIQTGILHRVSLGLVFQYHTTGSRIGQKDYSGSYTFNQIANGYLAGIKPEISILDSKSFNLSASVTSGLLFTGLKMSESLVLFEIENNNSESLSALSVAIYPAINFSVPVTSKFIWFLSSGRMFDTGGKVHLSDNKDAILKINENEVKTGWSGWRISTGLKFSIVE